MMVKNQGWCSAAYSDLDPQPLCLLQILFLTGSSQYPNSNKDGLIYFQMAKWQSVFPTIPGQLTYKVLVLIMALASFTASPFEAFSNAQTPGTVPSDQQPPQHPLTSASWQPFVPLMPGKRYVLTFGPSAAGAVG